MKTINKLILLLSLSSFLNFAHAIGDKGGNGGDFIRYKFISIAQQIFKYMESAPFKEITEREGIDVELLKKIVNIHNISISTEILRDNNGSVVDAALIDGHLYLDREIWWKKLVESTYHDFDTQMMVLHESFRLANIDDDNYKITQQYKELKYKVAYQNNFGSGRDFICRVDLYNKLIPNDGFAYARKARLLKSVTHRQNSAVIGSDIQELIKLNKKTSLYSEVIIGGDGYLRWSLASAHNEGVLAGIKNRKYISGAKVLYSPYPAHRAKNEETTIETDKYLIDITCNIDQLGGNNNENNTNFN